jgi:CheY-like chemotaxis protein/two-component sensor histidine kinase
MQGAQRGAALTQRLLAFARQQDLKTSAIDMAELVRGMGDLLDRSLGPRIGLHFDLAEGLPPARADANQVELAILNLAINARDAMPDGGAIEIGVDRAPAPATGELKPGDYVRVWIADTGAGMDEATLKRAVEPFFSTKALGKGTGLGLSMVHGLATQLGGRLQLQSQPDEGTVATLWLPVAAEAPTRAEPVAAVHGPSRSATILVVDDDPLIALSTSEMLADLGHEVIEVDSGADALQVLASERPIDLMMTDHAMPEMSGMELARRAQAVRPGLPILLATGYVDLDEGEQLDLPRLNKPYDQAQLRKEIDRLLEAAQ